MMGIRCGEAGMEAPTRSFTHLSSTIDQAARAARRALRLGYSTGTTVHERAGRVDTPNGGH